MTLPSHVSTTTVRSTPHSEAAMVKQHSILITPAIRPTESRSTGKAVRWSSVNRTEHLRSPAYSSLRERPSTTMGMERVIFLYGGRRMAHGTLFNPGARVSALRVGD